MGAQTVNQISDYYADGYFVNGTLEKYDRMPTLIRAITKENIVNIAREFIATDIDAMVAVSSVEKALINDLSSQLKFSS